MLGVRPRLSSPSLWFNTVRKARTSKPRRSVIATWAATSASWCLVVLLAISVNEIDITKQGLDKPHIWILCTRHHISPTLDSFL
eukprot:1008908-Pleurochrysis_carterae.AAC.1